MKEGIPPIEKDENKESIERKIEVLHKYLESASEEDICDCLERNRDKAIELGRGNHAVVYTVEDPVLGSVCVKEMIQDPEIEANDPEIEFEIQDELNQKGVKTPYVIAQVLDKESKKQYIVMERINGFSIKDFIREKKDLPENFDLEIFIEKLSKVVNSIHENNIIHRDLHSGNVMIDEEVEPVVIDFGMSSYGSPNMEKAYEKEITKRIGGKKTRVIDKGLDDKMQINSLKSQISDYMASIGK